MHHPRSPHAGLLAVMALLPVVFISPTQAAQFTTNATGRIDHKLPDSFDAILLQVQNPAAQTNQLWVNTDVNFNLDSFGTGTWESATWAPLDGVTRRAAAMLGTDDIGNPVAGRQITVRNLTFDHTDMDTTNVLLKFQPDSGNAALTLQDSSITGQMVPSLTAAAPFSLNASSTSAINAWQGQLSSATTLTVNPAATLTINSSGNLAGDLPTDSLYFNQEQNVATINGGTLRVLDSNVLFGRAPTLPTGGSTVTLSNGGTLQVSNVLGDRSRIETDTLTVAGAGSQLLLDDNATVTLRNALILNDGAAVTTGDSGQVTSQGLVASGSATITVNDATNIAKAEGVKTGVVRVNQDATLTVTSTTEGIMGIADSVLYATGGGATMGQIKVTGNAHLEISGNGYLNLNHGGVLNTAAASTLQVYDNALMTLGTSSQFTNAGSFSVDDGGLLEIVGDTIIAGNGSVEIGDGGSIQFSSLTQAQNTLATDNALAFGAFSSLHISLDATGLTNDRVTVGGSLAISGLADLLLSVIDDQLLTAGTKFALFDYAVLAGPIGSHHFNGYADGTVFNLGLNRYQILYSDAAYNVNNPSVITLTAVGAAPEPATLWLLGLGALGLMGRRTRGGAGGVAIGQGGPGAPASRGSAAEV